MLGKARFSVLVCGALGLLAVQACSSSKSNDAGGLNTDVPPAGTPGGPITVPVGTVCTDDSACGGGRCEKGGCLPGARCTDDSACAGTKCVDGGCVPASAADGIKNGDETDVDCGGLVAPRCAVGLGCAVGVDCKEGVCTDGLCAAPAPNDGVKNGDETDIDCGGTSGNVCAAGKSCNVAAECDSKFCTNDKCEPRMTGRQDGDETDVDCGGLVAPACTAGLMCLADTDCQSQGCDTSKHCALSPSCKVLHGGTTCGTGEFPDGNKVHESCCKSLPVVGFNDAFQPNPAGKTAYVDKYEITAGRMRAFVEATGGNVKSWIQAHRPSQRWNTTWENELPKAAHTSATINIDNSLLYPNDATYHLATNHPTQGTSWFVTAASYASDVGIDIVLGEPTLFPEFFANSSWPEEHYSANHASNCFNEVGSEGFSTYWFPKSEMNTVLAGSQGKYFSKDEMDEKALSCATFSMMAAFCAWDGGQLMTAEVSDYITNNTISPLYFSNGSSFAYQNGKLATKGNTTCAGDGSINTFSDGATPCSKSGIPDAYDYPYDAAYVRPELITACNGKTDNQACSAVTNGMSISGACASIGAQRVCREKHDGSGRVAPPGRLVADVTLQDGAPAGTEPWMDMIGNLQEAVLKAGESQRFDYRGYGLAYGSVQHHKMQQTTPRMKSASFGARCMRFK